MPTGGEDFWRCGRSRPFRGRRYATPPCLISGHCGLRRGAAAELWQAVLGTKLQIDLRGRAPPELLVKQGSPDDLARAEAIVCAHESGSSRVVALSNNSTSHTSFALWSTPERRFASLPNFDPEMFFTSMKSTGTAWRKRTAPLPVP